ncbi:MAG: TonB-dependent receptor [Acidobacteria bacterium]|nr:TonB-dependent receptor [Acidobacteriota bacterium]
MKIGVFLAIACLLLWTPQEAYAQVTVTTAMVSGSVLDETKAALPGATLTTTNVQTGITRTALADEEGRYRIPNLAPGNYTLRAELRGFTTVVRQGIILTVGEQAVVDVTLKVGELTAELVVTGTAPLVNTTTAALSHLTDEATIRELPLNGRDLAQLTTLQPGTYYFRDMAQFSPRQGMGAKIVAHGMRYDQNSFLLNGAEINDAGGAAGGAGTGLTGVDTVREFRVLTGNYSAEYRAGGGLIVSAVSKSGTNEFHGSAFEFHRNDNLDARNFFDPGPPPEFKRNQFGFNAGGPIVRERTFVFGSYEGLSEALGFTTISTVPSLVARQGRLPDPARPGQFVQIDPRIQPFLALFPVPNGRDFPDGRAEFLAAPTQLTTSNYFTLKADHRVSSNDSLSVAYTFDDSERSRPDDLGLGDSNLVARKQFVTIEEFKTISPAILNSFRFAFSRTFPRQVATYNRSLADLAFVPGKDMGSLDARGLSGLGDNSTGDKIAQNFFDYSDDLSVLRGAHSLKIGVKISRLQINTDRPSRDRGQYEFRTLTDFLRANPFRLQVGVPGFNDAIRGLRYTLSGFYIQDDYQARRNLTLNLGLRYEFSTTPTEVNGKLSNLRDIVRDAQPALGEPYLQNPTLRNVAPRLGLAWDMTGDGKTAVRSGVGVFFNPIHYNNLASATSDAPPFFLVGQVANPDFPNAFQTTPRERFVTRPRMTTIEFEPQSSYAIHYSLVVEREMGAGTVLSLGYVGTRGVHLTREGDFNTAEPVIVDGRKFFPPGLRKRNTNWDRIRVIQFDAQSVYQGFELGLRRRLSRALQFQASYTWSKSIDHKSSESSSGLSRPEGRAQDPWDIRSNRGLSDFDARHVFQLSYTWDLPFGRGRYFGGDLSGFANALLGGWQANGIINLQSGIPFNPVVADSFDRSRDLSMDNEERPDLVAGKDSNPVLGGPDQYFDFSSFTLALPGFYGNLGRNTVIGPGLATADLSLTKNISVRSISESFKIQLKAEFFNVLNRANFGLPGGELFVDQSGPLADAGRITKTQTTSRQVQFGLKLAW